METYSKLEVGQIVDGVIRKIEKSYIIVQINETKIFALLHISEVSHKFISDLKMFFSIGQKIKCEIILINKNNKNVKLSTKNVKGFEIKDKDNNTIEETPSGFSTLKKNIPIWISKFNN